MKIKTLLQAPLILEELQRLNIDPTTLNPNDRIKIKERFVSPVLDINKERNKHGLEPLKPEEITNEIILDKLNQILTKLEKLEGASKDLMNLDEACEFLKLGKARMYTLVRLKQIKHSKLGNRLWFSKNDLTEMINQQKK